MPQFKDRQDYEKWRAERLKQAPGKRTTEDMADKAPDREDSHIAGKPSGVSRFEKAGGRQSSTRTAVTASLLVVLLIAFAVVLFLNRHRLVAIFTEQAPALSREVVRPSNFNELLGTWSGREINGSTGWTFIFSHGYNVSASGPEGSYQGKAAIHWEIGADKEGMRVPPGAGVLDVDVENSSTGDNKGKTSVGAFAVYGGTTLKLCSGEPGMSKRPLSFDPVSGIRCFELTKTAEAPPPPVQEVARPAAAPEASSIEDEETRAARDSYKRCAEAIRSGNLNEAKTYIARATLSEMEQSGQLDMALGMITGMNIDEFRASRQGDRITFKQSQKQGDATMSMSLKMVKEDGLWKLGK